jgi:hypothetical protein
MTESTRFLIVLGVMIVAAVLAAPRVLKEANEREPIYGGTLPTLFNLIGTVAFVGIIPGILTALILGIVHSVVPVVLTLLATCLVSMLLYTLTELPAYRQHLATIKTGEDELWTAEKARTSGL